jgi:putative glycosyltransferase (TIGR04348 family)
VILLVTPTPVDSVHGNGVTARRWAAILTELGHSVEINRTYTGGRYTALVALHARKSADAVRAFHADNPDTPIVIAMTGTDVYPNPIAAGVDPAVLDLADRLIVLQRHAVTLLMSPLAERARVITQSMPIIPRLPQREDCFEVAFLAHIREVKDPLRLAEAVRRLPPTSRICVTHVGDARDRTLAAMAAAASAENPRYDWLGPVPRPDALALLARSRVLAVTSWHEGGANVVSEALAAGVPVVSSAIPGSMGMLGEDYPGYFPPGDAESLADVLYAAEQDRDGLYDALRRRCAALRSLVDPAKEKKAFAELLGELGLPAQDPAGCNLGDPVY